MLERTNEVERDAARSPDAARGLEAGERLSPAGAPERGQGGLERSEYRATIVEAIREVEARTGASGFVSADRAGAGNPRVLAPQELVDTIERAGAKLGVDAAPTPVYTIGEGGSIVNTVTGRTEYLAVHGEGARADLARASASAPGTGTPADGPQPVRDAEPLQAGPEKKEVPVDERVYAPRGGAPREVASYSHYNDAIAHPEGELSGQSRRYGDADRETQRRCMDTIIEKGRQHGMSDHEIALTLAIARVESGFNPDAAAGSTSAAGLGQMIDATGKHYGLDASNRWNADAQADALVRHTQDNMAMARQRGHGGADLDRYTYAYHHDGPSLAYGGLGIADSQVVTKVALYEEYVKNH